jgi:hypothetical protein
MVAARRRDRMCRLGALLLAVDTASTQLLAVSEGRQRQRAQRRVVLPPRRLEDTPFVAQALDGGKGDFPESSCIDDAVATTLDGSIIVAQCCDSLDASTAGCRRYVGTKDDDAGCVAGDPPRPHTYAQAVAICTGMGLDLCAGSCVGEGCGYNAHPVWSSELGPCALPPPQLPVAVLDGGSDRWPASTCVSDPAATTAHGATIVAQCCDPADASAAGCRRYVGTSDDAGCVAGSDPPRSHTFAQAVELCSGIGLGLCADACAGKGCHYNEYPVWTSTPCVLPPSPPPASSPPSPPPRPSPPSPPPPSPSPPPPSAPPPPATPVDDDDGATDFFRAMLVSTLLFVSLVTLPPAWIAVMAWRNQWHERALLAQRESQPLKGGAKRIMGYWGRGITGRQVLKTVRQPARMNRGVEFSSTA